MKLSTYEEQVLELGSLILITQGLQITMMVLKTCS